MKRNKWFVWLVVGLVAGAGFAGAVWAQDYFAEMDSVWAKRNGGGANARQVLAMAEQSFVGNQSYGAAWRAARACFWICDRTENTTVDKEYGLKGLQWAEKAIALNPSGVEGHYFRTLNLGEFGKGIGIARALLKGVGGKFEASGNKAIAIDGGFDRAGPLRAMGRYYQKLPRIKRDLDKAEQYYKKALAAAPCMIRTHYYLVELYATKEDWAAANAIAEQGLATGACPEHKWECAHYKKLIKGLQAKFPTL